MSTTCLFQISVTPTTKINTLLKITVHEHRNQVCYATSPEVENVDCFGEMSFVDWFTVSSIYHSEFLPSLGKHVKPLVSVVNRRSLTVGTVSQKPAKREILIFALYPVRQDSNPN